LEFPETMSKIVELFTEAEAALISGRPMARAVANPPESTVARVVSDDVQVTEVVRSLVEPSLKVPVAFICCFVPAATGILAGVTAKEVNVGGGGVCAPLHPAMPRIKSRRAQRALWIGTLPGAFSKISGWFPVPRLNAGQVCILG